MCVCVYTFALSTLSTRFDDVYFSTGILDLNGVPNGTQVVIIFGWQNQPQDQFINCIDGSGHLEREEKEDLLISVVNPV